jgi:phosphatidylserine/phosphatidylglycerophosphate/cardiolipin synthase-like enzyme
MQNFDIDSLLRFTPPEYLCERCLALLSGTTARCPVCGVQYTATEGFSDYGSYLAARGLDVSLPNLIEHSQQLALIARQARQSLANQTSGYPPMRGLLEALLCAERFIHFTTYGVSALLLGAIKMASLRVDVRGVVSGIKHDTMYRELTEYADESPRLNVRLFQNEAQYFPHQKIIVIDGLMAFKGSANLTDFGWRKAAQGREVIEIVTDVAEVVELHNRFFSPVWATFTPAANGKRFSMTAS